MKLAAPRGFRRVTPSDRVYAAQYWASLLLEPGTQVITPAARAEQCVAQVGGGELRVQILEVGDHAVSRLQRPFHRKPLRQLDFNIRLGEEAGVIGHE